MPTVDSLTLEIALQIDDRQGKGLLKTLNDIQKKAEQLAATQKNGQVEVARAIEQTQRAMVKGASSGNAAVKKAAEDQFKAFNDGEKRKQESAQKTANVRVSTQKEVAARLKTEARGEIEDVFKAEKAIVDARRDGIEETGDLQRAAAGARAKLIRKEADLTEEVFEERIRDAEAGSKELLDIESERIRQTTALTKKEGQALRQEQTAGRGRSADELGENFATISQSVQSGDIAGAAAFVGQKFNPAIGQMAGIAGVAADLIGGLVSKVSELGQRALDIDNKWQVLNNTLNLSTGEFNNLQVGLQAIQRPSGVSEEAVANLARTVGKFPSSDPIDESAEAILNLSRVGDGEIGLETIAAGVGRLTQITGSAVESADLFALTAQELVGVVAGPLDEALTELGTVASKAALTITDTSRAARESAAIFTLMTKSGFEVSEATSAAEEVFLKLNDAVTDPAVREMITKALPEGISALDAGIEEGNVSATKFVGVLADMGEEGQALAASLGGTAGEGLQFLLRNAERTGTSIEDVIAKFDNVEGSASKVAASLTPLSVQLDAIKEQRFDDFATNFGRNFSGAVESGKANFVGLLDTVATADFGIFEGLLDPIRDLFVDSRVEAEKAFGVFKQANEIAAAVQGVVSPIQEIAASVGEGAATTAEFFAAVNEELPILAEHAAGSAEQIKRIQENVNLTEAEKLEEVNKVLTQIEQQKAAESIGALNDALELSAEAVRDLIEDTEAGFFDQLAGQFSIVTDLISGDLDSALRTTSQLAAATTGSLATQVEVAARSVEDLDAQWQAANGNLAEQQRLSVLLGEERSRQFALEDQQRQITEEITSQIETSLEAQQINAERTGETFDRQVALTQEIQRAGATLAGQPKILAEVRDNLSGAVDQAEDLNAAGEDSASVETDLVGLSKDREEVLKSIGVERKEGIQDQITEAKAVQVQNTAIITQLQSQLAIVDSILAGNETQKNGLLQIAQIEASITAQKQSQATIAAGGEAEAVDAITSAELTVDTDLEGFRAQLVETIDQLESDNSAISEHIDGLQSSARSSASTTKDREKLFDDEKKALQDRLDAGEITADEFNSQLSQLENELGNVAETTEEFQDAESSATQSIKSDERERSSATAEAVASLRELSEANREAVAAAEARNEQERRQLFLARQEELDDLRRQGIADRNAELSETEALAREQLNDQLEAALERLRALSAARADDLTPEEQISDIRGGGETAITGNVEERAATIRTALDEALASVVDLTPLRTRSDEDFKKFTDANDQVTLLLNRLNAVQGSLAGLPEEIRTRTVPADIESLAEVGEIAAIIEDNAFAAAKSLAELSMQDPEALEDSIVDIDEATALARAELQGLEEDLAAIQARQGALEGLAEVPLDVIDELFRVLQQTGEADDAIGQTTERIAELIEAADQADLLAETNSEFAGLGQQLRDAAADVETFVEANREAIQTQESLNETIEALTPRGGNRGEIRREFGLGDDDQARVDLLNEATAALAELSDEEEGLTRLNEVLEEQTAILDTALEPVQQLADNARSLNEVDAAALTESVTLARRELDAANESAERLRRFNEERRDSLREVVATNEILAEAQSRFASEETLSRKEIIQGLTERLAAQRELIASVEEEIAARAMEIATANAQIAVQDELIASSGDDEEALAAANAERQKQVDLLNDLEDAQSDSSEELEGQEEAAEDTEDALNGAGDGAKNFLKEMEKLNKTLEDAISIIDATQGFFDSFSDKDATLSDQVLAGAELAQQVGQVLLNSPFQPLQLIGAAMVGSALITQAIVKLANLFKKGFDEALPQAQKQAELEQNINDRIEKRSRLIDLTVAAGSRAVDQAREQLDAQTDLLNLKLQELGIAGDIEDVDRTRAQNQLNFLDSQTKKLSDLQTLAEAADEEGNKERKALIDDIGEDELLRLGVDTSRDKLGQFTDLLDKLEAGQIDLTAESEKWTGVLEGQAELLELQNQLRDEQIGLSELLIRLGADEAEQLAEQTRLRREALNAALAEAADPVSGSAPLFRLLKSLGVAVGEFGTETASVGDLSALTTDQILDLIQTATGLADEQISGPIADLVGGLLDAVDAENQFNEGLKEAGDLTADLFELQKRILNQQLELNDITEEQFTEDLLDLLEDELKRRTEIEDELKANGAAADELLKAAIARMDIEIEIQNLLKEQNNELDRSDAILTGIVARRQDLLETFRSAQGRGDLTPAQQARLQALTSEAVARLKESGATDEEIDSFLKGLPQFEKGGFHDQEEIVRVHPGEFTLPANVVQQFGRRDIENLVRNSPSNLLNSPEARIITQSAMSEGVQQMASVFNLNFTVNVSGVRPDEASETARTITDEVSRLVRRGITEGTIPLER